MAKKSKSQAKTQPESSPQAGALPFLSGKTSVDPTLASLFANSSGPVKAPVIPAATPKTEKPTGENAEEDDEVLSELEEELEEDESMDDAPEAAKEAASESAEEQTEAPSRKRKRAVADDLEASYMRRIAKEEQKDEEKRRAEKAQRTKVDGEQDDSEDGSDEEEGDDSSSEGEQDAPKHETQAGSIGSSEVERSNRTVFLGNVSNEAIKSKSAKKTLIKHLESVLSTLPESTGPHKVESIRFRSTAFASGGKVPKRAAFARKEVLDETTPSTNAYAVYSTVQGYRKGLSLNGSVVLDRHLRVDSVAHPAKVDNKRCVFVGNLAFVDLSGAAEGEEKKKKKAPADVEEGLWRTFNAHTGSTKTGADAKKGNVESVRVIRDSSTRVGKGFAYVQFYDQNCVEEALLLNEKKFPPMLPRKLRVTRARKVTQKREPSSAPDKSLREADKTLHGRAGKLFGRAGAAKLKADSKKSISGNSMVFEGYRATDDGSSRIRTKMKSRGSKGKPKGRSSKRAAAYRESGAWKKSKTQ